MKPHAADIALAGVLLFCVLVLGFWVGLRAGLVPCQHRCYWCGTLMAPLQE